MVGHTHQDFLSRAISSETNTEFGTGIDLTDIKDFREPLGLFDLPLGFYRKVNITYLDEQLDDIDDWRRFINSLRGIDRLYIIDDRNTINPIMNAYADELNRRYLFQLNADNIPATIISHERQFGTILPK